MQFENINEIYVPFSSLINKVMDKAIVYFTLKEQCLLF